MLALQNVAQYFHHPSLRNYWLSLTSAVCPRYQLSFSAECDKNTEPSAMLFHSKSRRIYFFFTSSIFFLQIVRNSTLPTVTDDLSITSMKNMNQKIISSSLSILSVMNWKKITRSKKYHKQLFIIRSYSIKNA